MYWLCWRNAFLNRTSYLNLNCMSPQYASATWFWHCHRINQYDDRDTTLKLEPELEMKTPKTCAHPKLRPTRAPSTIFLSFHPLCAVWQTTPVSITLMTFNQLLISENLLEVFWNLWHPPKCENSDRYTAPGIVQIPKCKQRRRKVDNHYGIFWPTARIMKIDQPVCGGICMPVNLSLIDYFASDSQDNIIRGCLLWIEMTGTTDPGAWMCCPNPILCWRLLPSAHRNTRDLSFGLELSKRVDHGR
jgi:hypothetical protein